jgi:hypothetical protein
MRTDPLSPQRRRALRWLAGSASGLSLFGCGGGSEDGGHEDGRTVASQVDATKAVFGAAEDFSAVNNPAGPWSYGWTLSLASTFSVFEGKAETNSVGGDTWGGTAGEVVFQPLVMHARNDNCASFVEAGRIRLEPGQLILWPGMGSVYAVVRFTVAAAGDYSIATRFYGGDFVGPTDSDVHVLLNEQPIFDGTVTEFAQGPSFEIVLHALVAGTTIDFAVGTGMPTAEPNDYFSDATGLDARIVRS